MPQEPTSLDFSHDGLSDFLREAVTMAERFFANAGTQPGYRYFSQEEVMSWFDEPLPETGMNHHDLFKMVQDKVLDTATGNVGPNMYAYVMAGGNHVSAVADFIASTVSQNTTKWHLGPSMTEIEKRVVAWTAEMIGYTPDAGGVMVSGGSGANLAGLTVARNIHFMNEGVRTRGLFGMQPFTVYCSTETHNCIDKSVAELGIGTDHLRRIPAKPDFTADVEAMEIVIQNDIKSGFKPFCLVGNAGTVNTGAIDDLEALSRLAKKYNMWFHVDGAYGGLAASIPGLRSHYKGMEAADSVALDFHKWLYQPYEVGCVLVKSWDMLRNTYLNRASYLDTSLQRMDGKTEFNEHYFQLSRNSKAFKVWMSLKAYGFGRFREMIHKDIQLAAYLADQVESSEDFQLCSRDILGITCFRYTGTLADETEITTFNRQLIAALEEDGRVFITGTTLNGRFVIRACVNNHRKQEKDIDYLLETIRDVARKIMD